MGSQRLAAMYSASATALTSPSAGSSSGSAGVSATSGQLVGARRVNHSAAGASSSMSSQWPASPSVRKKRRSMKYAG